MAGQQLPGGKGAPMSKKKKQQVAVLGGVAAVAAVIVILRARASGGNTAAPASTSGTTGYTDTGSSTPYTFGGYGGDASGLEDQLSGISEQLATLVAQENPPGAPAPTKPPKKKKAATIPKGFGNPPKRKPPKRKPAPRQPRRPARR